MKSTFLATLAITASALAIEPPPATLPSQAKFVDKVIVPVPSEVFSVLDKLGRPKWAGLINRSSSTAKPVGDTTQIALMLGTIIAEGFIAVEAEDADEVRNLGRAILSFSNALGVRKAVVRRANSIVEFADKKQWPRVRVELDGALTDVRDAMVELSSESLANLVSIGGWLRGTEALCAVVSADFDRDGAELLRQPMLIDHFGEKLAALRGRQKDNALVGQIRKGLAELKPISAPAGNSRISEKSVNEAGAITKALVAAIQRKSN
jgi:hypothetical protein